MTDSLDVFQKHYEAYCERLTAIDLKAKKNMLGLISSGKRYTIPFFNQRYLLSNEGITDEAGNVPQNRRDYMVSVILANYVLMCPDRFYFDPQWVSFKDFKKVSSFTNVNYFASDTEGAIEKHFSTRLDRLSVASIKAGGVYHKTDFPYDLSILFTALPRVSLLLLFNDGDDEFPAKCTVLFRKHSEFYLDPESLAMTGAFLALSLGEAAQSPKE